MAASPAPPARAPGIDPELLASLAFDRPVPAGPRPTTTSPRQVLAARGAVVLVGLTAFWDLRSLVALVVAIPTRFWGRPSIPTLHLDLVEHSFHALAAVSFVTWLLVRLAGARGTPLGATFQRAGAQLASQPA